MLPKLALTMVIVSFPLAIIGQTAQAEKNVIPVTVAKQARWVAQHGGIIGSCYGCATSRMKLLSEQLIHYRFRARGEYVVQKMICISRRESGDNPGAVNSQSRAAGLFQFLGHSQFNSWLLLHDPVYAVNAAWSLSDGGTNFHPWDGGSHPC